MTRSALLATTFCLAACGKSPTLSDAPAPAALHASGESVELVQVERMDPSDRHHALMRDTAYQICKATAELLKRPVKPFPPLPAGYGETRTTTITNGKSMVTKAETYIDPDPGSDPDTLKPETGCAYPIKPVKQVTIDIVHNGKTIMLRGENGALAVVEEMEDGDAPEWSKGRQGTEDYTEARTVNGVPLRCLPANFWTLNTNKHLDARELCVYATDGVVIDTMREPITVLSHTFLSMLGAQYQYTTKLEPVSFRKLGKGEPDPYQVSTWLK